MESVYELVLRGKARLYMRWRLYDLISIFVLNVPVVQLAMYFCIVAMDHYHV